MAGFEPENIVWLVDKELVAMDLTSIIVLIMSSTIALISGLILGLMQERAKHHNELAKLKAEYDLKQKESLIKKTIEVRGLAWEKTQKAFRATEFLLSRVGDNVSDQLIVEERIKAGDAFNDLNNYLAPNSINISKKLFSLFQGISKNLAQVLRSFDLASQLPYDYKTLTIEIYKNLMRETAAMINSLEDLLRKDAGINE